MLRWAAAGGGAHSISPMTHHLTAAPSCLAVPLLPGASYAVVCALRGQISIFFSFYFISFGAVSGFLLVVHSTNRADVLV